MKVDDHKADWLSIFLHFILGAVVGCLMSFFTLTKGRHSIFDFWLREELIGLFLLGGALVAGGIGSIYGDRLWLSDGYRVIRPDSIQHSKVSFRVVVSLSIIGGLLIVYTLIKHFS